MHSPANKRGLWRRCVPFTQITTPVAILFQKLERIRVRNRVLAYRGTEMG